MIRSVRSFPTLRTLRPKNKNKKTGIAEQTLLAAPTAAVLVCACIIPGKGLGRCGRGLVVLLHVGHRLDLFLRGEACVQIVAKTATACLGSFAVRNIIFVYVRTEG